MPDGKDGEHQLIVLFAKNWTKKNLPINPLASDHEILRRASYDLVGLPPSIELVEEYLNNNTPEKFDKLVDSLLASPTLRREMGKALARPR